MGAKNAGGAIFAGSATMTVSGSTLSANSANSYGGAIDVFVGALTIDDSSLTNNAAFAGGGIYNSSLGHYGTPTVTVQNSSGISGNTSPAGQGADVYNLGVIYVDGTSIGKTGIVDGNPARPTFRLWDRLLTGNHTGCTSSCSICSTDARLVKRSRALLASQDAPFLRGLVKQAGQLPRAPGPLGGFVNVLQRDVALASNAAAGFKLG